MNRREFFERTIKAGALFSVFGGLLSCERQISDIITSPADDIYLSSPDAPIPAVAYSGQDNASVLEVLKQVDPGIKAAQNSMGVLVDNIMGLRNGVDNRYWEFWVNGQVIENLHAANYRTRNSDIIEWRYFEYVPVLENSAELLAAPPGMVCFGGGCSGGYCVKIKDVWHQETDYFRNRLILKEARAQLDTVFKRDPKDENKGHCKWWAQNVVSAASDGLIWLPSNVTKKEDDSLFYNARWNDSANVEIVWQDLANWVRIAFPTNWLRPGHIIQFRWAGHSGVAQEFRNGPHTVIVESVSSQEMTWLNCNFKKPWTVTKDNYPFWKWRNNVAAWTVYQVK